MEPLYPLKCSVGILLSPERVVTVHGKNYDIINPKFTKKNNLKRVQNLEKLDIRQSIVCSELTFYSVPENFTQPPVATVVTFRVSESELTVPCALTTEILIQMRI